MSSAEEGALPALSGVVVHWRNEEQLQRLVEAWPRDPRFELVVVDNSASLGELPGDLRKVTPEGNQGFSGGVNRGVAAARGPVLLLLNPDVVPREGALPALLEGFELHPEAAGLAPRLSGVDPTTGDPAEPQFRWQLRPLPSPWTLLQQTLLIPAGQGPSAEPPAGSSVAQPAAAALALRRPVFEELEGFDESFHPAWFEDVDFARRLADRGGKILYWPASELLHELGGSVPGLGYGPFLWVYYRNLQRYLAKHHGSVWTTLSTLSLVAGMGLRLLLLPLVRPRRARSRGEAARGLLGVAAGALSGWRLPRVLEGRFARPGGKP